MIEAKGLSKSYGGRTIFKDLSLELREGEIVSILGPSGIGKSTLARVLSLYEKPDSGSILLDGKEVPAKPQRDIQLIFQNPLSSFDPKWTIIKSLTEGMDDKNKAMITIAQEMKALSLDKISLLSKPRELSGGEIQRLALLRAKLTGCRFIIADEITSSLDAINRKQILELLIYLKEKNTGIVFITHDSEAADFISDRSILL